MFRGTGGRRCGQLEGCSSEWPSVAQTDQSTVGRQCGAGEHTRYLTQWDPPAGFPGVSASPAEGMA